MKGVGVEIVGADVIPHPFVAPIRERVQLEQAEGLVPLEAGHRGAGDRLPAANPGDPEIESGKRPSERLDLPDRAALLAVRDAPPKRERAFVADHRLDGVTIRDIGFDRDAVALADSRRDVVGFLVEAAGIEREDARVGALAKQQIRHHDIFGAEARGEGGARMEAVDGPADRFLGAHRLDGRDETREVQGGAKHGSVP